MFFEFSKAKVLPLSFFFVALFSMIAVFLFLDRTYATVELTENKVRRGFSDVRYAAEFKLPYTVERSLTALIKNHTTAAEATTTTLASTHGVPVLLYHGEGGTAPMSDETFVSQLRALKENGWNTITLEQFTNYMKNGAPLPDKSFLLTFDDGRKDTFYSADPVLRDLNYTAVMFVITGFSLPDERLPNPTFYLTRTELDYMAKSGRWELESHGDQDHRGYDVPTATSTPEKTDLVYSQHFLSNYFWLKNENRLETQSEYTARVTNDLAASKKILETNFGIHVTSFAYPFNDFGQDTVNNPTATGVLSQVVPKLYTYAFYQTWPGNGDALNYPDPNQYFIKRIEPGPTWTGEEVLSVLTGGAVKHLPYQTNAFQRVDWSVNWGKLDFNNNHLILAATADSTGGTAFLNGTGTWTNYRVDMGVSELMGTASIIARNTDGDSPYLVCAFSENRIYLERHDVGGTHTTIANAPYSPPQTGYRTYSMSVNGANASCSAYGKSVSGVAKNISPTGNVGVEVWDQQMGAGRMEVSDLKVTGL